MNGAGARTTLLRVDDLATGYGSVRVLNGVTLECNKGEAVAVLGPNGHGKTTLLRTLSGLHPKWRGRVLFEDRDISDLTPDEITRCGVVHAPQGDLLFSQMTVLENLLVGSFLRRAWTNRRPRLDRVWELFPELRGRRDSLAESLSGGERRMCAVGRALMADAQLLLVDEPSLGLAPIAIDRLYDAFSTLRAGGLSILLVEEGVERIRGLADRAYLLDAGAIVRGGTVEDVLSDSSLLEAYLG